MTKNEKLRKDIMDHYLNWCYKEHGEKIPEKYQGYILNAMEDYSEMKQPSFNKIIFYIISISAILGTILMIAYLYKTIIK